MDRKTGDKALQKRIKEGKVTRADVTRRLAELAFGTALGAKLHRTSAVADNVIIGLDKGFALEQVKAGDVLVEYDKLIDQQLERAAITAISGFAKICDGAAAVLNV